LHVAAIEPDLDARPAREPLHPLPRRRPGDDDGVVATSMSVSGYMRRSWMAKLVICASGKARPMQSAVHDGKAKERGSEEGLERVAAADLERHDRAEPPAEVLLHHRDGARDRSRVGEPLLADERRAHVRDHGDRVVVGEVLRVEQRDDGALAVELPHC